MNGCTNENCTEQLSEGLKKRMKVKSSAYLRLTGPPCMNNQKLN